ncbi:MAG: Lrp/AsnC family transcriptional regulator, partial [Gammaproteobacteria bacterium]|nr:Lrp/AsnC family transcriptional regulator [Gammaproteobacteria bacterium]
MELNAKAAETAVPLTDEIDRLIISAIQDGLPVTRRPYAAVASALNLDEATVIARIAALTERRVIKRFGIVLRHHELGYRANAMVVWD